MKKTLLGASCALAMAAAFGPARADVTFYQAYTYTQAYGAASGATSSQSSNGYDSDSASTFPVSPLDAEAYATATAVKSGVVQAAATDDEVATLSLSSPSSGSIDLSGATSATVGVPSGSATAYSGENYGIYYFDVSAPATFNLSYALTDSSTSDYYYDGYYQLYNYSDGSVDGTGYDLGNTTGSASYKLTPGLYYFEALNYYYEDYVSQSGIGSQTGSHNDQFNFSISGAPEPSTWALMIAGVGLVGGALRSGRRSPALGAAAALLPCAAGEGDHTKCGGGGSSLTPRLSASPLRRLRRHLPASQGRRRIGCGLKSLRRDRNKATTWPMGSTMVAAYKVRARLFRAWSLTS